MTIGKRKGAAAKGTGASPGNVANSKFGGALSKNDHWYLQQAFGMTADPGTLQEPHIVASGGIINDWTNPTGDVYRTHTFGSSGTFEVTQAAIVQPNDLVWIVIAGGGGGGGGGPSWHAAGGGGGGGFRSGVPTITPGGPGNSTESAIPASVSSYTVTIGGGGKGGVLDNNGIVGSPSVFGPITSTGGGYGGGAPPSPYEPGGPGGSGGGAGFGAGPPSGPTPGGGVADPTQGYGGGYSPDEGSGDFRAGAGGGGAGGAGEDMPGGMGESASLGGIGKQALNQDNNQEEQPWIKPSQMTN